MKIKHLLSIIIVVAACNSTDGVEIKERIINTKSEKHIKVKGSRLYMVLPEYFSISKRSVVFDNGENSMLMVLDNVGSNYYTETADFYAKNIEGKKDILYDYRQIEVCGYPAIYALIQKHSDLPTIQLIFGDSSFCTTVWCVFPEDDKNLKSQIINSLNSIYYDKSINVNPFETAKFKLDDSNLKIKFAKYSGSVYEYTNINNDPFPYLTITQLPFDDESIDKVVKVLENRLEKSGYTIKDSNINKNPINNYETYELTGKSFIEDKPILIYYCVLINKGNYLDINGYANSDDLQSIEEFKKLSRKIILN